MHSFNKGIDEIGKFTGILIRSTEVDKCIIHVITLRIFFSNPNIFYIIGQNST